MGNGNRGSSLVIIIAIVLTLLVALLIICKPGHASTLSESVALSAGVNGVWFDDAKPFSGDVEVCGNAKASLSPHLTAVGSVNYGFCHSYFRSTVGGRVCATDVTNPDFNVGLGIQYHMASIGELPNEWCPDVSLGLRPWPKQYPNLLLTALGWYGMASGDAGADVGIRWRFNF
jgi:hypothetical protein